MPDNIVLNLGVGGETVAADLIAGIQHQRVKTEWGADGIANEVDDTDGKRLPIKPHMAGTATRTQVADNASSVTILASNANRKGAVILNDSSAMLFLALGTGTATSTNYTTRLYQYQAYEVPSMYTGQVIGIWETDPNDGGARVTELT
jgi:hypothetical protein